jgi:hypothetical protein
MICSKLPLEKVLDQTQTHRWGSSSKMDKLPWKMNTMDGHPQEKQMKILKGFEG